MARPKAAMLITRSMTDQVFGEATLDRLKGFADVNPEIAESLDEQTAHKALYDNLTSIYNFVYIRIVEANIKKDVALIDDAVKILQTLRDAWAEAIDKKEPK